MKHWQVDNEAIRFYYNGGQINAHFRYLNPFLRPRSAWPKRVKNFFDAICKGLNKIKAIS